MWGRVCLALLLKSWWKTLPTQIQRHTAKQTSVLGGMTYRAEKQHKSNIYPFGKTAFTGFGKSTDKLHGAAWSAASKHCMNISFHPPLSLILHLCFGPGGKHTWTQEGARSTGPRVSFSEGFHL